VFVICYQHLMSASVTLIDKCSPLYSFQPYCCLLVLAYVCEYTRLAFAVCVCVGVGVSAVVVLHEQLI